MKKAFAAGLRAGHYTAIAEEVIRAECGGTPREPALDFRETALGARVELRCSVKLAQNQVWKRGDDYLRIVQLERLEVQYKAITNLLSGDGTHHHVSKKEFCRLIKDATLLTRCGSARGRGSAAASIAPIASLSNRGEMPRPFFLFAPGAGAPSSHPWMQRWAK